MWFNKRRKWYDHLNLCWKCMGQNSWSIFHKKHSKMENKQNRKYRNRSKYAMPIVYSKGGISNQKNNKWWVHSGSGRWLQLFIKFYIYVLCTSLCVWYIHNKIIYKWLKNWSLRFALETLRYHHWDQRDNMRVQMIFLKKFITL